MEREKTATSLGAPRQGDHDDVGLDLDQPCQGDLDLLDDLNLDHPHQGDHDDADHLDSRHQIIVSATLKSKIMPNYQSGTSWFPALDVPQQLDLQWTRRDMQKHGFFTAYRAQNDGRQIIKSQPAFAQCS